MHMARKAVRKKIDPTFITEMSPRSKKRFRVFRKERVLDDLVISYNGYAEQGNCEADIIVYRRIGERLIGTIIQVYPDAKEPREGHSGNQGLIIRVAKDAEAIEVINHLMGIIQKHK
jgi:hypothetical protein